MGDVGDDSQDDKEGFILALTNMRSDEMTATEGGISRRSSDRSHISADLEFQGSMPRRVM